MTSLHEAASEARRSPAGTVLLVCCAALVTLLGVVAVDRARSALTLVLGAAVVAMVVAPAPRALARWMPKGLAVAALVFVGIVGTVGIVGAVAWDVDQRAGELSDGFEAGVDRLPDDSGVAVFVARAELMERANDALDGLAPKLVVGDDDPLAVAGWVSKVVVIGVLAGFMLIQGDALLDAAIGMTRRASTRERWHTIRRVGCVAGGGYVRRTLAVSVVHGTLVGVGCAAADLPGAISLGAWAGITSTVPIVGGPLAWAPVIVIATAVGVHPAVAGVIGLVAIVVDWRVRRTWVDAAVHVGPLVGLLALGVGLYTLGIPGAVIGLAAAAALCAVSASVGAPDVGSAVDDLRAGSALPTASGQHAMAVDALEPPPADPLPRMLLLGGVVVIALFVAYLVFVQVQQLLVWVVLGAFIGIGLDRPIVALSRRLNIARVAAIAAVLATVALAVVAVAVAAGPSIADAADGIVDDAPEAVADLERLPVVGAALEENGASERVEDALVALPDRLAGSGAVERVVSTAGDGALGLLWTLTVMMAVLLDGPRLVDAVARRVPLDSRRRARRLGRATYTSLSNVAAAAAFVAVLNGSVVFLVALALGVPLAPVLGVWAMLWNFVPQVGGFVGATPLVLLALGQGPWHALAAAGIFICYQTFENHVIQPAVGSRAVSLPPLVVLIAVLIGGSVLGLVGAILAAPLAGVVKVLGTELRGHDVGRVDDRPIAELSD
jgi:putative heme transporter